MCGEYLKKGSQVYVEGSIRTKKYTDKEGVEKYATEIRGDRMQMLGSKGGSMDDGGSSQTAGTRPPRDNATVTTRPQPVKVFDDDDIPF